MINILDQELHGDVRNRVLDKLQKVIEARTHNDDDDKNDGENNADGGDKDFIVKKNGKLQFNWNENQKIAGKRNGKARDKQKDKFV